MVRDNIPLTRRAPLCVSFLFPQLYPSFLDPVVIVPLYLSLFLSFIVSLLLRAKAQTAFTHSYGLTHTCSSQYSYDQTHEHAYEKKKCATGLLLIQ